MDDMMTWMVNFHHSTDLCTRVAMRLHAALTARLSSDYILDPCDGFCFRISLPQTAYVVMNLGVRRVSVSVPVNAMGNRTMDDVNDTNLPSTYETALVNEHDDIMYVDAINYSDVRRFFTINDLVTEIMHLGSDDSDDDSDSNCNVVTSTM